MISTSVKDNEAAKFKNTNDGTAVRVATSGDMSGILKDVSYDDIQAAYPNDTTEIFTYILGSIDQATITVTYTDSTKNFVARIRRT